MRIVRKAPMTKVRKAPNRSNIYRLLLRIDNGEQDERLVQSPIKRTAYLTIELDVIGSKKNSYHR